MLKRTAILRKSDSTSRLSVSVLRPKKCAKRKGGCGEKFTPSKPMQVACSPKCAENMGKARNIRIKIKQDISDRRETRAKKEALKGIPQLIREADKAFADFIRARDKLAGWPCISSGQPLDWSGNKTDAGHFRSRGAASHLRYHEDNCHAQTKHENQYLAGNLLAYRPRLIERIGLERVEALENDNRPAKWTRDGLRDIRDTYRAKARALKAAT